MTLHRSNIRRSTVGYTGIRGLSKQYLELEDLNSTISVDAYIGVNVDDLRQDYLWRRSEFFIQLAGLCGDSVEESVLFLEETIMEFSL